MARMLLAAVLLAVASAPALAQVTVPPFSTTRVYDQARFEAAIAPYTQAIGRNPNDARAHYWLGVAYLHVARLHRLGLAPFAAGFGAKAVASLEQALRLRAAPEVMLALLDAYAMVGAIDKHRALVARLAHLAQPLPVR